MGKERTAPQRSAVCGSFKHTLWRLHCLSKGFVLRGTPQDTYFVALADAMHPLNGLIIHRRVPPGLQEHNLSGSYQVEPHTACLQRHYEALNCRVRAESVHGALALCNGLRPVKANIANGMLRIMRRACGRVGGVCEGDVTEARVCDKVPGARYGVCCDLSGEEHVRPGLTQGGNVKSDPCTKRGSACAECQTDHFMHADLKAGR